MIIPLSNERIGYLCERIHVVEHVLQVLLDTDPDKHRVIKGSLQRHFLIQGHKVSMGTSL